MGQIIKSNVNLRLQYVPAIEDKKKRKQKEKNTEETIEEMTIPIEEKRITMFSAIEGMKILNKTHVILIAKTSADIMY